VLPFQVIEQVDEPRAEKSEDYSLQGQLFDERGRQLKGWTNKLIWGDNKLVLSSLKDGPLREEIEKQGGLKLIYIDPPFDVGADFSMDIEIGSDTFTKKPSIIEEIAYRDTWGKGADSFLAMIYERLILLRDLLAEDGCVFSVFYSQDSIAGAEASLKDNSSKIVVERGQIVKVSKDKSGIVTRERHTHHWTDWIDYWAVDFNFESKREIVRVRREKQAQMPGMERPEQLDLPEYEEVWTGDYIFENEWQSFRTKKDRSLELTSVFHECAPGRRKLAVKVVDIFGNDTMTIVEVTVGGKK